MQKINQIKEEYIQQLTQNDAKISINEDENKECLQGIFVMRILCFSL